MARPTDWVDTIIAPSAFASGLQTNASLVADLTAADLRGTTVVRTLVRLGLASSTVAGAWGVNRIDLAIGICSREAFAAGVFPDPNVGSEKPPRGWLWRTSVLASQNGSGGPIVTDVIADIRGGRKIENGVVYLVVNNSNFVGTTFSILVQGLVRLLIKLA